MVLWMVHLWLVSGVAALGLSYAVKQRRHFKATEFIELLKNSAKPLDGWYTGGKVKTYYRNHLSAGASPTKVELSKYVGKMGTGLVNAGSLLNSIEGSGSDMVVPNVYVAESTTSTLNLAYYFVNGETLTYTCTSSDPATAAVSVSNTLIWYKNRYSSYYSESKQRKRTVHCRYRP